jgi:ATP-dependent exoDNAse (exonuclease V) alpha subunit
VAQILSSRDFVTLFRGAAGTGKSRTLGEVFACLQEKGAGIHVLTPQRQQALDLAASGMSGATTISEFLVYKPLRPQDVIIVDEAGQIGGQTMLALLTVAKQSECRLIVSGDTRQHGAVEASDALRAIEQHAGLQVAELVKIRRQDPASARNEAERAFVTGYREAVEAASRGDCARSFEKLDSLGAIVSCETGSQHEKLAAEFMRHLRENESALVVAQTWSEIHRLNNTIRTAMKEAGHLPCEERKLKSREVMDLTNAQKRDPRFYDEGTVLVFRKKISGFKPNQSAQVIGFLTNSLLAQSEGRVREVPFSKLDGVALCKERELELSSGDCLQLKANAKTRDGRRLTNGEFVTVSSIAPDGTVHLQDGRALETRFRDFVLGYAVTSYGSQGKTVDHVLFSDSAVRAATNQQQWYVTISRGRKSIRIFTEDREGLAENIQRAGARELALDLEAQKPTQAELAQRQYSRGRRLWNRVRRFLGLGQPSHRITSTANRGQTP